MVQLGATGENKRAELHHNSSKNATRDFVDPAEVYNIIILLRPTVWIIHTYLYVGQQAGLGSQSSQEYFGL